MKLAFFYGGGGIFFGGGGIILSEAEAYIEIVYIDQWMDFFDTTSNKIEKKVGGVRKITTGIFEFDQARALVHFARCSGFFI